MIMTRQQEFEALISRMQKAENREKYDSISLRPKDSDLLLLWHIERARGSLRSTPKDDITTELSKADFDVSIRAVKQILDEQGWA